MDAVAFLKNKQFIFLCDNFCEISVLIWLISSATAAFV